MINCIVQYNYAENNFGPCILFYSYNDGTVQNWAGGTARFNICESNNTGGNQADIWAASDGLTMSGVAIYNNTVYTKSNRGLALALGAGHGDNLGAGNVANTACSPIPVKQPYTGHAVREPHFVSTSSRNDLFSKYGRVIGVSIKVGPRLLTRMLCGASSIAIALVKPSMACFDAQ